MHSTRPLAILDEILGLILEFIFRLVFEVLFGAIFEFIGALLARAFPPLRHALGKSGLIAIFAAASAGAVLGLLSMLFRPQPVAQGELAVTAAIMLAPIPMAAGMVLAGRIIEARERKRSEFEHWGPALTFAYAFVLARVAFRHLASGAA